MLRSFFTGLIHAIRHWKMALLLWAVSLLFAIPVVLPIVWLIFQTTRETEMAQRMMSDQLDIVWLIDLFNRQFVGFSLESIGIQTVLVLWSIGIVYMLMHTLFSGGMISVLASDDRRFRMWEFWAGCGAYFWRFFRLLLISRIFYGAVVIGFLFWQRRLNRLDHQATAYSAVVKQEWASYLVLLLLLALIAMVFDYAKLRTVYYNRRGMFRETFKSWGFALRHLLSTLTMYLMIAAVGWGVFIGLAWLRSSVKQVSGGTVLLAFFIGQLAIGMRLWNRIWFYASQSELLQKLTAEPAPVSEESTEAPVTA